MKRPFGLSIVIPVYNGAESVGALVNALANLKPEGGHEIVLVNDGSPDNSDEVCRKLAERTDVPVTYVNLSRNYGEHNAVMAGLRHARGDYVITMDDDLQNPPSEVVRLYDHCRNGGWDVAYTYYAQKKHEPWRNLGSRFTNWVADQVLDKPKGVYLSSFRCMSAFVVESISRYEGPFPYVDGLIMQVTSRIDRIMVEHLARVSGHSNYTLRRLVRLWLNLFVNFSALPLHLSTFLGVFMGGLGAIWALVVAVEAMMGDPPEGWASIMVTVLIVSGAQFIMLGMMGEYIGRLFISANRKPQFLVRDIVHPPGGGK
jgi:undecaprenyl-phosphate 4-deoxy-4-formamido-L-arabinose transferase